MTPEAERETLRQMIIGALAIELPAEVFEVLMDVDNRQRRKMNQHGARCMNDVSKRTVQSYCEIDAMPADLRECVYEFGFAIVKACQMAGVTRPAMIRLLVREIWNGARQPGQRGKMGSVPRVFNTLDWVLMQAGENISSAAIARVLADNSYVIAPKDPTTEMVIASMAAIEGMGPLTKRRKHTIRLMAAMRAAEGVAYRKTATGCAA